MSINHLTDDQNIFPEPLFLKEVVFKTTDGVKYNGAITAIGDTPVTLNSSIGFVTFTNLIPATQYTSIQLRLNNSLITPLTSIRANVVDQSGFGTLVMRNIFPNNGYVTFEVQNLSTIGLGLNSNVTISFEIVSRLVSE
jgi:hypothetical protein